MSQYTSTQQYLIDEIANAISIDEHNSDYKNILTYFKQNQKYKSKAILLENRYLYGTFVKEARKSLLVS